MLPEDLPYWLALWRTPGIGPGQFRLITDHYPTLQFFFEESAHRLRELGFTPEQLAWIQGFRAGRESRLLEGVDRDLEWLEADPQHHILTWADDDYPPLLREIQGSPPLLFVRGQLSSLLLPQIAVVGSRHCSRQGKHLAQDFGRCFSNHGLVTTSGLALGIDAAAHRGALQGAAGTLAVLAHGLDEIYPHRNRALGEQVVQQGALVSEFPVGVAPRAEFFPRRNRIISGLSLGVLVVEAAIKSGSLITAHQAVDQGREVFAIPGSINDPLAKGCHALIRNGARLVETAQQIVEELMPLLGFMQQSALPLRAEIATPKPYPQDSAEAKVLAALEYDPTPIDQLVGLTGLSVADISTSLVMLELDGAVQQQQGGYSRV
ncbi:MAG: DNA-processing protein DprA [Pseudomonadota bacterium]|nr:DNA-protecting protein DprA [Pseudomonadales bacterium]MDY6919285.1 DNA-processing protein DprA [Pseudomonadota bacterium]